MKMTALVPHHRKLFWLAVVTGAAGLLLQATVGSDHSLGLALLATGAGLFVWAWRLMGQASDAPGD